MPSYDKTFFFNPQAEIWFYFVHCQAATFHQVVTKIEGENISAVEVTNKLSNLKENFKKRKENHFLPIMIKGSIKKLENDGLI